MTVTLPLGRTVARKFLSQSNYLTRLASSNLLIRVSCPKVDSSSSSPSCSARPHQPSILSCIRSYATTASSKPAGRPKAHTGRAVVKRSPRTKKTTTPKKKPVKKTTARRKTKPKPKAKPRKATSRAAPSKTALDRARRTKDRDLKARALLKEPKKLPETAWALYFTEHKKGVKSIAESAQNTRESARNFKQLTPEEHEKLNHSANQNKKKNNAEYEKWVAQYTPAEIRDANNARRTLSKEKKTKEGKAKSPVYLIKDVRLVKRPRNSYSMYTQERWASGDFKHMALAESARLIGREWKALSAAEKKPYEDQATADLNRYTEEATSVYGKSPAPPKPAKRSSDSA